MSELSGAESEAKQQERPDESVGQGKGHDTRHHPGPAVSGKDVGYDEEASAEAKRALMDDALTSPPAGAE